MTQTGTTAPTSQHLTLAGVSDFTAILYMGALIEFDATQCIFTNPGERRTAD